MSAALDRRLPPKVRGVTKRQRAELLARQQRELIDHTTRTLKSEIRRRAEQTAGRPAKLDKPAPKVSNAYARASAMLYEDPRMSDSARRLVLRLVQWARGRASVDAYIEQLADSLGFSVRTVRYAQRRAKECGFLEIERTRRGKLNDVNIYHLTDKARLPKTPYPRRGYLRSRPTFKLQDHAPHEVSSKDDSPLLSPQGFQKRYFSL